MNTQERTLPNAVIILVAITLAIGALAAAADLGLLSPSSRTAAEHLDSIVLDGYEVTFDGATDNGDGTSTWTYTVTVSDADGVQALSHWVLGLDLCADVEVVSADPDNVEIGVDPTTGVDGIKWDDLSLQPGQSDTYSVTIDAELGLEVFIGHVDVGVKGGQTIETGTINGPDCTLEPPTLTVEKVVVNDDGGTAVAGDFTLRVDGDSVTSGVANTVSAGAHVVSEDDPGAGYATTIGEDCDASGKVSLSAGENKTCTITNNDVPPTTTTTPTPTAAPTATPSPTPTPAVLGVAQDPTSLPDTGGSPEETTATSLSLLLGLAGLALISGAGTLVAVAARRRR